MDTKWGKIKRKVFADADRDKAFKQANKYVACQIAKGRRLEALVWQMSSKADGKTIYRVIVCVRKQKRS